MALWLTLSLQACCMAADGAKISIPGSAYLHESLIVKKKK
jgi:hypothetical protein